MQTTEVEIQGMTCLNCITHIEKALEAIPGVREVTVELDKGATIRHDGVNEDMFLRAIESAGGYRGRIASSKSD